MSTPPTGISPTGGSNPITEILLGKADYTLTPTGILKTPAGDFRITNLVIAGKTQSLTPPLSQSQINAIIELAENVFRKLENENALDPKMEKITIISNSNQSDTAKVEVKTGTQQKVIDVVKKDLFTEIFKAFNQSLPVEASKAKPQSVEEEILPVSGSKKTQAEVSFEKITELDPRQKITKERIAIQKDISKLEDALELLGKNHDWPRIHLERKISEMKKNVMELIQEEIKQLNPIEARRRAALQEEMEELEGRESSKKGFEDSAEPLFAESHTPSPEIRFKDLDTSEKIKEKIEQIKVDKEKLEKSLDILKGEDPQTAEIKKAIKECITTLENDLEYLNERF